jgi:Uri superfamily endonuclease
MRTDELGIDTPTSLSPLGPRHGFVRAWGPWQAPSDPVPPGCVTYQLLLRIRRPTCVRLRRGPGHQLMPGYYVYTGSARRGIAARVARHRRRDKPRRWHIDTLTRTSWIRVIGVRYSPIAECRVNQALPGTAIIPGFGASDCRAGCRAHLQQIAVDRSSAVAEAESRFASRRPRVME